MFLKDFRLACPPVTFPFVISIGQRIKPTKSMSTNNDHRVILPYVSLHGRCEEAIGFYRKALGAELEMMLRFKDCPDPMPEGMLA